MRRVFALQLRRDRLTLPIWIVGIVALIAATSAAVKTEFADSIDELLTVALATPALLALRGIPNGDTIASAVHFQGFAWLALMVGLMNVFLATRHGRADEEKGRRELVLATPVRRLTPMVATLVLAVLANAIFAALAAAAYVGTGLEATGAVLSATALAGVGLAFFGIALVAGELAPTSRAANAIGVVAVLAAYALRAAGDALGTPDLPAFRLEPAWPSYLSPIGWGQLTLPFTANDPAPLAALAGLAVVTIVAAFALHARRDLGASLLRERPGPAAGGGLLHSAFGLAWRLQRAAFVGWAAGAAILGLLLGSLVTAIAESDVSSPALDAVLASLGHGDRGDLARALIPAIFGLVGILSAAAGVQAIFRLRDDETDGRAEELLALPLSRLSWAGSGLAVAALTTVGVLAAAGVAALAGFAVVGNADDGWLSLGQALVQGPAALVFVAAAALAFGLVPRLSVGVGWALFGLGAVWGTLGGLFDPPEWTLQLSPFFTVPALPTDDWAATLLVGGIALAAAILALVAVRRRDLTT